MFRFKRTLHGKLELLKDAKKCRVRATGTKRLRRRVLMSGTKVFSLGAHRSRVIECCKPLRLCGRCDLFIGHDTSCGQIMIETNKKQMD